MNWSHLPTECLWTLVCVAVLLATCSLGIAIARRIWPAKNFAELYSRTNSWWWMVGLFFLALISGRVASIIFFAIVSTLAFREFINLMPQREADGRVIGWAYVAIAAQYFWVYTEWYGLFIIFIPVYAFLLLPFRMVIAGESEGFIRASSTLHWGLMTTVFSLSHAAYLFALTPSNEPRIDIVWPSAAAYQNPGVGLVILLVLLTEINDVGQYVWGKLFGRRRIAPRVSPNKTVAGFLGGVVTTSMLAGLLGPWMTPLDWKFSLLAGAIVALSGFAGDLCISMLKRDLGIKDTGTMLPGHGGILDRVDSLTYTAPLYFHFVYYLYF